MSDDAIEKERKLVLGQSGKGDSASSLTNPQGTTTTTSRRIADRESDYQSRRSRQLSPARSDPLAHSTQDDSRSFSDIMKEKELERQEYELRKKLEQRKNKEAELKKKMEDEMLQTNPNLDVEDAKAARKRKWDMPTPDISSSDEAKKSLWEEFVPTATPVAKSKSRWDETPVAGTSFIGTPSRAKSRWDATPIRTEDGNLVEGEQAFAFPTTPQQFFPSDVSATPGHSTHQKWDRELDWRNRYFSDEDLDALIPKEGYAILEPPANYVPITTPSRKLMQTPSPQDVEGFYLSASTNGNIPPVATSVKIGNDELSFSKPEDFQYFGKLLDKRSDESLSIDEAKERKIMKLLLKIKNGTPQMRKSALRQITEKARDFGASALFDQILPLLMSPSLEDQERHLLVKLIDRILYKLDDLVRPYVHKILVVIEPLLIEEDYYARMEGREIISNLTKAAGLATMIATLRPDIDHNDEYVRNTTARAFAVVAFALGIPALLPFLKAVCRSKKSWMARHTGVKIVQQIALLLGCSILPHLKDLVDCIAPGLSDEQHKVRIITALALAALAESSAPYGIESFDGILKPLNSSIKNHRGKALAAFIKAFGQIIVLMDANYASHYAKDMMPILVREFQTPDDEMKKIVLKVVRQCASSTGISKNLLRTEVLPDFFKYFWQRRMALDKRTFRQIVDTTVEIAIKVGLLDIIPRIVEHLKDDSDPFRRMTIETLDLIVKKLGAADIEEKVEEQLIDGLLFAFQEQVSDDSQIVLNGIETIVNSLGLRMRPYLMQISSMILWRLSNRSAKIRQLAADLVAKICKAMIICEEDAILAKISVVLYENLGEEYPDVLGSILGALKSIVNVIGMNKMNPPIKELLPRLTPILRNRHEKVQENCIDLVGRIADRSAEAVSAREWMRICFELIDMLKAQKKSIRRASVNTFGYIAKAIGPQDVLSTLLNNLKVQERQNRLCTTIAIAIVAETCAPFTVLPALMNEYRVPELNVQNGVLKALSFLFEYIGEMGKDYIFAVTPLLEDALIDRDLVHRQTAASVIKHMSLGVVGFGCEEALLHLLNFLMPNIFEKSPHVIIAVIEALDALRLSLGPCVILQYLIQGLFHPAKKVRNIYWKAYNNLYIGSQEALVPYYPRLEGESFNYCNVLDIVI